MTTQTFTFEQLVQAPIAQVYRAFTNATLLREWMCNTSTTDTRIGGRVYMAWNSGFYVAGEFTVLEKDQEIAFTWAGRGEPAQTHVRINLAEKDGGTLVTLAHEQVGSGETWENTIQEVKDGWQSSLENLASVLEIGQDLRFTMRPMLGIIPGDFNPEIAKKLEVPINEGIRLDGVADGMGAKSAGLQSNDVIVRLAGCEIKNFADLSLAVQNKRAGDQVEVVFYRHAQQMSVMMELSRRSLPVIPETPAELTAKVQERYMENQAALEAFCAGISEAEASFKPAPNEWSVKEVLVHLIHGERYLHQHIPELVGAQESWADDYYGNLHMMIDATLAAYPGLQELLAQYKKLQLESVALFAHLPDEFVEQKGSYWRLAFEALDAPYHLQGHLEQMQAAVEAARKE